MFINVASFHQTLRDGAPMWSLFLGVFAHDEMYKYSGRDWISLCAFQLHQSILKLDFICFYLIQFKCGKLIFIHIFSSSNSKLTQTNTNIPSTTQTQAVSALFVFQVTACEDVCFALSPADAAR